MRPVAAFACALAAGCTQLGDADLYQAAVGPSFNLVSATPADNASGVPLGTAPAIVFNDFPDPATAISPTVRLSAGGTAVDSVVRVDLVSRSVVITPKMPLAASTAYTVEVATSQHKTRKPLGALSGATLSGAAAADTLVTIHFTTGTDPGGAPPTPPARTLAKDVQPQLTLNCAFENCHASVAGTPPAEGMDLSDGVAAAALINATSTERPALARVNPGHPETSYLLRKLLGTPDIAGSPMPLGGTLDEATLRLYSDWILEGAP